MSSPIIAVENLSKRYVIGRQRSKDDGFRHVIESMVRAPLKLLKSGHARKKQTSEEFWALKDISFEVQPGEVVGIIGRNGAGKSTLLKILSRITEPTSGRIAIDGRVASLLEVGTGFHAELTGRENIFLNGAILGMSHVEIKRKFDEIVAFSEVEKFLDTPVKRYSSGMYVRLAFAVAAHLDPEILIVDEVLAVGDAAFQKKCLGKMQDVSKGGRTVLFVSHNLDSVIRLCSSCLWLDRGGLHERGEVNQVIGNYQNQHRNQTNAVDLIGAFRPLTLRNLASFTEIRCQTTNGQPAWNYDFGAPIAFLCTVTVIRRLNQFSIAFAIFATSGFEIAGFRSHLLKAGEAIEPGCYEITILTHLRLSPGIYSLNLGLRSEYGEEDYIPNGPNFEISTNEKAANLMADTMRAACIPDGNVSMIRVS